MSDTTPLPQIASSAAAHIRDRGWFQNGLAPKNPLGEMCLGLALCQAIEDLQLDPDETFRFKIQAYEAVVAQLDLPLTLGPEDETCLYWTELCDVIYAWNDDQDDVQEVLDVLKALEAA